MRGKSIGVLVAAILVAIAAAAPELASSSADETHPVLLAAGDIAGCDWSGDEATAAILDGDPDATVQTLGDNAYPKGMQAEFQDCYGPSWGRHKSRTRAAVGNHEYEWFYSDAWGHYEYFGAAAAGEYGEYFYSYDLGPWHVVVLNSNCAAVSCAPGSAQEQWLRTDLASSEAACTLAIWHHPRYSSGSLHGDDAAVDPFWRALFEHGAELVLVGHDHHYERFAPIGLDGAANPAYGLRQFIVGTGGAPLRPTGAVKSHSEVRDATAHGILRLELRSGGYDWQFLAEAGKTFTDAGSGSCHGRPPADPGPPSDPTLSSSHSSAWSNDDTVEVTWTGASDSGSGVDGFSYSWTQSADGGQPDHTKDAEETATGATSPPLADGDWWFHLRTRDNAGNWSGAVHLGPFRIDTVAPATTDDAPAGWRNTATTVTLTPTDGRSGVASTQYRVNGGPFTTGRQVTLAADGVHTVEYRSTDNAGNVEALRSATVRIDTTKPTTTDDSPAGWRRTPVLVTLTATDIGSGVAATEYRVDGGPFTAGTQVQLSSDGVHSVEYRSTDVAGNVETLRTTTVRIDGTPPVNPVVSSSHAPGDWSNDPTVDATWSSASDATSGVDGHSYEWSASAATIPDETKEPSGASTTSPVLQDGDWWFHLRTVDGAGNWSGVVHLGPFRIDTTAPSNPTLSSPSHDVGSWSNEDTVTVDWSGAAGETYSYEWSQSDLTIPDSSSEGAGTRVVSDLPDGSWWFHVSAYEAGSWSGTAHLGPFLIDTTAPETYTYGFEFWSSEPATFRCSLDAGAYGPCASPVGYENLAPGEHVYRVYALDRAGNADGSPAEHRWIVAAPPPPPPPPPPPLPPPPPPAPPPAPRPPAAKPKPKKVTICFKRRTIKVPKKQLAKYRKKGAKLGRCKRPVRRSRP